MNAIQACPAKPSWSIQGKRPMLSMAIVLIALAAMPLAAQANSTTIEIEDKGSFPGNTVSSAEHSTLRVKSENGDFRPTAPYTLSHTRSDNGTATTATVNADQHGNGPGVYGGGPLYKFPESIDTLRASGFTWIYAWTVHLNAQADMNFNAEFPLVENGKYIGDLKYPNFASDLARLKTNPTSTKWIDRLGALQSLLSSHELISCNDQYRLRMQKDGNLVIYNQFRKPVWATGTYGKGGTHVDLQRDGDLVICTSSDEPVWASRTHGTGANGLVLGNNGSLVLYKDSTIVKTLHGTPLP